MSVLPYRSLNYKFRRGIEWKKNSIINKPGVATAISRPARRKRRSCPARATTVTRVSLPWPYRARHSLRRPRARLLLLNSAANSFPIRWHTEINLLRPTNWLRCFQLRCQPLNWIKKEVQHFLYGPPTLNYRFSMNAYFFVGSIDFPIYSEHWVSRISIFSYIFFIFNIPIL